EIMSLAMISSYPIIPVGLDIEPNADEESLGTYLQRNGLSGYYALSPPYMTRSLVNSFGMEIISPATAPVVMVCPQGEAKKLRAGLKPATEVLEALQQEC
ncbi:MAG TPA: hypothetical protein VMW63_01850, partial [Methanoregulaceae archaeon]|nr:hypothetical protein [Methanoregulaceae archaeon]